MTWCTCGECRACKTFEEGHSLNIFELDAASNNSVEDIRNLIQQVQIAPQVGPRRCTSSTRYTC
jgi:DNA polymerase-3 subunit gamma/tau